MNDAADHLPTAPEPDAVHLLVEGLRAPIALAASAEVIEAFMLMLADWPVEVLSRESPDMGAPELVVRRTASGYAVPCPGTASIACPSAAEAAHALVGAVVGALLFGREDSVCLHASAVQSAAGLLVFVGPSFAGKSSLGVHAAALGARFFGDDLILVELGQTPHGRALGLKAKLRLPIPPDAGASFHRYVAARATAEPGDIVRLDLDATEAASFGEARKIAALIAVTRAPGVLATLGTASRAEMTQALVRHAFAPGFAVSALVERMAALATAVPCRNLVFESSLAGAAAALGAYGGPA
ncbi:MAG: hypothetical protein ACKVSF_13780 [Alphaproteobacteria bacterium]